MQEVKGKYNTAKVFTDVIDETSLKQIQLLCNQELMFSFLLVNVASFIYLQDCC